MFEGIITPIVTPFNRDKEESINYEATEKLINYLIEHGVKGIFILGSNGEFHVVDEDEKVEFAKKVVEIVNKRVPVFVGTGCCSTRATVRLSKKMEEIGADALSVITPYFLKFSLFVSNALYAICFNKGGSLLNPSNIFALIV